MTIPLLKLLTLPFVFTFPLFPFPFYSTPIRHIPILPSRVRNNSSTPTRPITPRTHLIQFHIRFNKRSVQNLRHTGPRISLFQLFLQNMMEILSTEFSGGFPCMTIENGEISGIRTANMEIINIRMSVLHGTTTFSIDVF